MDLDNNTLSGYVGRTFHRLTIDRILDTKDEKGNILCECTCHCNESKTNKCTLPLNKVVAGQVKSCGCYRIDRYREAHEQNLVGRTFGRWTVLEKLPHKPGEFIRYRCQCNCEKHTIADVLGANLVRGKSTSCGCRAKEINSVVHAVDYTGFENDHLKVIRKTDKRCGSFIAWLCVCKHCNREFLLSSNRIRIQQSCGKCDYAINLARERARVWNTEYERLLSSRLSKMATRCYNKNCPDYKDYGGRGIYICQEWREDRRKFVEWGLTNGFRPELSIDRIDHNGPYAPWNCRWVKPIVQSNNRRVNHYVTVDGMTHSLSIWAYLINKKASTLHALAMADAHSEDVAAYIAKCWGEIPSAIQDRQIQKLNQMYGTVSDGGQNHVSTN